MLLTNLGFLPPPPAAGSQPPSPVRRFLRSALLPRAGGGGGGGIGSMAAWYSWAPGRLASSVTKRRPSTTRGGKKQQPCYRRLNWHPNPPATPAPWRQGQSEAAQRASPLSYWMQALPITAIVPHRRRDEVSTVPESSALERGDSTAHAQFLLVLVSKSQSKRRTGSVCACPAGAACVWRSLYGANKRLATTKWSNEGFHTSNAVYAGTKEVGFGRFAICGWGKGTEGRNS